VKGDFAAANRNFTEQNFALMCKGRFLSEVRVCLDKDLNPRACGSDFAIRVMSRKCCSGRCDEDVVIIESFLY